MYVFIIGSLCWWGWNKLWTTIFFFRLGNVYDTHYSNRERGYKGDSNVLTSGPIFLIPVGPLSQLVPRSECGWSAGWEWLDCDFVFFNCLRREHSDCDYCHLAWEYGIWYLYLEWENSLDKGAGGGREDCNCLSDASKDYLRALLFSLPESSALRSRSSTSLSLFTAPGDHTVTLW